MTPFILWLTKAEVDELIYILAQDKNNSSNKGEIFNTNELEIIANSTLQQNKVLLMLLRKLKPFSAIERNNAIVFGKQQKCEQFNKVLDEMKLHCIINNKNFNQKEFNKLRSKICEDCLLKNKSCDN